MGSNLPITGIYDKETMEWVNAFQLKYKEEVLRPWVEIGVHSSEDIPTGYVYKTTLRKINMIMCPELNLGMPNLDEDRKRLLGTTETIQEKPSELEEEKSPPEDTVPEEIETPEVTVTPEPPSEIGKKGPEQISPQILQASLIETILRSNWLWIGGVLLVSIIGTIFYLTKKKKKREN